MEADQQQSGVAEGAIQCKQVELTDGVTSYTIGGEEHKKPGRNVLCVHGIDHAAFVWTYVTDASLKLTTFFVVSS